LCNNIQSSKEEDDIMILFLNGPEDKQNDDGELIGITIEEEK